MIDGFTPWPEEFVRRYEQAGYWQGRCLGDLPAEWARKWPGREALVADGRRISYSQLSETTDLLALRLLELGIAPQDRVIMQLPNVAEFVPLVFALFRIGALPVMALPAHREHEIGYLLGFAEAKAYAVPGRFRGFDYQEMAARLRDGPTGVGLVLVSGGDARDENVDLTALVDAAGDVKAARKRLAPMRPDPRDVAMFLLSGGTTGMPKLIPRTHDDYIYNLTESARLCEFDGDTVYLVNLPASHNFPFGCPGLLGTLANGGRVVMAESPRPEVCFPVIEREHVTVTAVVPAVAIQWMEAPERKTYDLASLRLLQVGGARMNPEAARRVRPTLGCALQQVFGMAEGLLNYTRLDDPEEVIVHTQGRPMSPGDEIRVVDAEGNDVAEGMPGELMTRGPYTLRGYFRAPEHNARAFTKDGFYRTGDVVRRDALGNLIVEGRDKDLINRGGEKISAEEIENLVLAHDAVLNAAAVAMPDRVMGERICVYVQLRSGHSLTLDELRTFMKGRNVAAFKLPERLEVVHSLPLTNVGKVNKKALRDDIAGRVVTARGT